MLVVLVVRPEWSKIWQSITKAFFMRWPFISALICGLMLVSLTSVILCWRRGLVLVDVRPDTTEGVQLMVVGMLSCSDDAVFWMGLVVVGVCSSLWLHPISASCRLCPTAILQGTRA